jgi:RimJ/RimL family protein N-acetyltransferase
MFPKAVYPLTPDQLEEAAKNRFKPTVILHRERVVAYANFYDVDDQSCWLGNVIVAPDYRGKGAATYLIEVMTNVAAEELNVRKMKLVCHNTNTRGLLFYAKHGFKPYDVSIRQKPSGELVAGILMEKDLSVENQLHGCSPLERCQKPLDLLDGVVDMLRADDDSRI